MMRRALILFVLAALHHPPFAEAFEGRISATFTQGSETRNFLYTVGTNQVRVERTETNWPHARNIVALPSGEVTLLMPHNRSFVRLPPPSSNPSSTPPPGFPSIPAQLPSSVGPQSPAPLPSTGASPAFPSPPPGLPPGIGPQANASAPPGAPGMPTMPNVPAMPNLPAAGGMPMLAMPNMPPMGMPNMPMAMPMGMGMEKAELKATGERTNLLGQACQRYELKQRGETLEVWATDKLLPFQPWQANQPPRFQPRTPDEQWQWLLHDKGLFPLRVVSSFEGGTERFRFEVTSIKPEKIRDPEGKLFAPPPDYHQITALPF